MSLLLLLRNQWTPPSGQPLESEYAEKRKKRRELLARIKQEDEELYLYLIIAGLEGDDDG